MSEDTRLLEDFFGPQLNRCSNQVELWGRAMTQHYDRVAVEKSSIPQGSDFARIPKILHFIWLGSKEIPNKDTCLSTWRQFHPDWDIQIWTDDTLAAHEDLQFLNRDPLEYACKNRLYGMASDILRLELLWKYGGLYIDVDYVCIGNVDSFHDSFDFYCGASCTHNIEINNGLLASKPRHVLLLKMMKDIHSWWQGRQAPFSQISAFLADTSSLDLATQVSHDETIAHTGPGLLTRTVGHYLESEETAGEASTIVVFPYTVFHPLPNTERHNRDQWRNFIRNDTKAIHLWQCSWQTSS